MSGLHDLPENLPEPPADGACDHLLGRTMPDLTLPTTNGRFVNFGSLGPGRTVIYCYPHTGVPGEALPEGWDDIPGARGCTPEACSFRDHAADLGRLGTDVFGLSTQTPAYQRELAERLHLPFEIISDAALDFTRALDLPTFEVDGLCLIKRLTLIVHAGEIEHVFYPVFPPDTHASDVVTWLESRQ